MLKSDIINSLHEIGYGKKDAKLTKAELKLLVDALFNTIGREVSYGARVEIRGFGAFSLRKRAAGKVRNPRHGTTVERDERYTLYFRPGRELAKAVNIINETDDE